MTHFRQALYNMPEEFSTTQFFMEAQSLGSNESRRTARGCLTIYCKKVTRTTWRKIAENHILSAHDCISFLKDQGTRFKEPLNLNHEEMRKIPFIPLKQVVQELGVSRQWIYDQAKSGVFKIHHIGGKSFLHIEDIIEAATDQV